MKLNLRHRLLAALLFLAAVPALAHDQHTLDEQTFQALRGHGSLNVVFVVIGVILAGLLFFLWRIDKKVSNLEKRQ